MSLTYSLSSVRPAFTRAATITILLSLLRLAACDSGASSTTVLGQGGNNSRIGDFVWFDKDRDGIQDPTEPGIPDVRVVLKAGPGLFQFTHTDSQGHYEFTNLPAGRYQVGIDSTTLPALALLAPCNAGTDDALDNDCAAALVLPDGQTDDTTVDFGVHADFVKLDFETEDDFSTPLQNGQDISAGSEFGILATIDGLASSGASAAIFDSDPTGPNASSSDPDLLVGLGNVLILQENARQTVPGIYDRPDDDARGGQVTISFGGKGALLRSIDLIDIDPSPNQDVLLGLVDAQGRTRDYHAESGWTEDVSVHGPPGYRTLDLTTLDVQPGFRADALAQSDPNFDPTNVRQLNVRFLGSGALDNVVFAPDLIDGIGP